MYLFKNCFFRPNLFQWRENLGRRRRRLLGQFRTDNEKPLYLLIEIISLLLDNKYLFYIFYSIQENGQL